MTTSAAPRFKAALFSACQSLYAAPVQVTYDNPGTDLEPDIVAVGRVWGRQTAATMGTPRSRDEETWCDVTFSCYRGGGPEADQTAMEAAFSLLATLETYVRLTDTTLAGAVRLTELADYSATSSDDPDVLASGRVVDLVATFHAYARI